MNLHILSATSITISSFRYSRRWYKDMGQRISRVYQNSQIHKLSERFWEKLKIFLRYSFLGKITETKQAAPAGLDNSRIAHFLINLYKECKARIKYLWGIAFVSAPTRTTNEGFNFLSVKGISTVVVTAITVNMILSIILQRPLGFWRWLAGGAFLFLGILVALFPPDWPALKENIIFLKYIKNIIRMRRISFI